MLALITENAEVTTPVPVKILGEPDDVAVKNETPDFNTNASNSSSVVVYGIKSAVDGALNGRADTPLVNTMYVLPGTNFVKPCKKSGRPGTYFIKLAESTLSPLNIVFTFGAADKTVSLTVSGVLPT